jgi:rubrerythrin
MTTLWYDLDELEDDDFTENDGDEKSFTDNFDENDDFIEDDEVICSECGALVEDGIQCQICGLIVGV